MRALALAAVFLSGVLSMGFQLLGSRLLAPYFGTSLIVWAFLISTFLGAFSLGSMLGGSISRLPPRRRRLAAAAVAAVSVTAFGVTALFGGPILAGIDAAVGDIRAAALLSCLALFLVPVLTLSCWPPMVTEALASLGLRPGHAAGQVYGVSTIGNIAGVMLTAFALIPSLRLSTMVVGWWAMALVDAGVMLALFATVDRRARGRATGSDQGGHP